MRGSNGRPQSWAQGQTQPEIGQISGSRLRRWGLRWLLKAAQTDGATLMAIGLRALHRRVGRIRGAGLRGSHHERRCCIMAVSGLGLPYAASPSAARQQLQQEGNDQRPQRASHAAIIRLQPAPRAGGLLLPMAPTKALNNAINGQAAANHSTCAGIWCTHNSITSTPWPSALA